MARLNDLAEILTLLENTPLHVQDNDSIDKKATIALLREILVQTDATVQGVGSAASPLSVDHNALTNTHNLTTDIDHDAIANNHESIDITGREIGATGSGTNDNWYKIASMGLASQYRNTSFRLLVVERVSFDTRPRIYTLDFGVERDAGNMRVPRLTYTSPHGNVLPDGAIFRATVEGDYCFLWFRRAGSQFNIVNIYVIGKFIAPATTLTFVNELKDPDPTTAPTGDTIGSTNFWQATSSWLDLQQELDHNALDNYSADRHYKQTTSTLDPTGTPETGELWLKVDA